MHHNLHTNGVVEERTGGAMNLVIDLGQSGVRIKSGDEITSMAMAKSTNASTLETLETIFKAIPNNEYENVFLSLTGVNGKVKNENEIGALCRTHFRSKNIAIMDDGFAAFVGALGSRSGVVLTIGSGVVAISGDAGKFAHTDGKGSIFGDFGSGFWLGQAALRKAVATLDGRDNAPELVELLKEELAQLDAIVNKVGPEASLLCITTAKTVVHGAEQGVQSAIKVLEAGADHLSATVNSAWRKLNSTSSDKPFIVLTGGLTRSSLYVNLIQERVSALLECNFIEAEADHLVGAEKAAGIFPEGVEHLFKWVHFN